MATITFGKTGTRPYGVLTVTETSTSAANNTSTLSIKLVLKRPYSISSSATKSAKCTINGTTYSWSGSIGGSGDKTLISQTQTVKHNDDGTKTISLSASIVLEITWDGTYVGTISGSGTMALTNIARYATVSQNLSAKTETTIIMNWSSDSTIDYIWYSSNDGSTWVGYNTPDGKSGSYTISGLSPNTTYKIKTRVRRKDNQLSTDSAALSVETYAYPFCNDMPNFTIGDKLKIGFYNPLGRSITANILGADGSQISNDTTTGTSISGYAGSVVVDRLYASIPNSPSGTYRVKVTCGSQVNTKTGGTYTVNKNNCAPSIGSVSYKDINSTSVSITRNNQDIVRNQSVVSYTASGLQAQKYATVKACSVNINGNSYNLTLSGNNATGGNAKIDSSSTIPATFTVTDSRGVTATKSINVNMLDWSVPSSIINLHRQDNFYSETDITVDADYSSINGNNIITITYQGKKEGDTEYSISGTLQDNIPSTFVADNNYDWDIVVTLVDSFGGRATYNLWISRGIPIIYFDRLKSSVGINCFPVYEKSLEVDGVDIRRSVMTRSLSSSMTNLSVNTYSIIPLNLQISTGDNRLTSTSDGGIKIGKGINQILVSGRMAVQTGSTSGNRHLRIIKNSYGDNNTLSWNWSVIAASTTDNIVIPPMLANVAENDVIYLCYYVPSSTDTLGGNAYGGQTSLTVETVG